VIGPDRSQRTHAEGTPIPLCHHRLLDPLHTHRVPQGYQFFKPVLVNHSRAGQLIQLIDRVEDLVRSEPVQLEPLSIQQYLQQGPRPTSYLRIRHTVHRQHLRHDPGLCHLP